MTAALAGLCTAMLVSGIFLVIAGARRVTDAVPGPSRPSWSTHAASWWVGRPRRQRILLAVGLTAGVVLFGDWHLGAVLALAMMVNQVVAALGGVLVPLTLERMGLDPALASGTFVTTLTDVMGFFAFLGLATVMLT